jgi:hypothetical protein
MRNLLLMAIMGSFLLCGCGRSDNTNLTIDSNPKGVPAHNPTPPSGRPPGLLSPTRVLGSNGAENRFKEISGNLFDGFGRVS